MAAAGYSITTKTDVQDETLLNAAVHLYTHFCEKGNQQSE